MTALELTGERTLPGIARENYWYRRHVAAYRFAANVVRGTVVDVGTGEGYGAALLSRRAPAVGLELDPVAVDHAGRAYPLVRFIRADAERMPLRADSVDGIVALQVVEHLDDADAVLAAARRALRPGCALVVSTPNRATFPAGMNPWHAREYDARELRGLVERRFEDVRLAGVHHGPLLALVDRALGEPVQHRLTSRRWEVLSPGLRAVLARVGARAFRISPDPESALDLVAVGRVPR